MEAISSKKMVRVTVYVTGNMCDVRSHDDDENGDIEKVNKLSMRNDTKQHVTQAGNQKKSDDEEDEEKAKTEKKNKCAQQR